MKTLNAIAIFAISVAGIVHAQNSAESRQAAAIEAKQQFVGGMSPDVSTSCAYTFTSGTGNKFMKYCVTKNGNIAQFQSPSGVQYISTAPVGEGYAFCDFDTQTQYYDYAGFGDSGNWQAPVLKSSSGTVVKIDRTTTNGLYTLSQTITQNSGEPAVQITLSLHNNDTKAHHLGLLRWADIDANGSTSNNFDFTYRTAMGYGEGRYGLEMQYVSGSPFNGAYSQDIPGGPNSCQIFTYVVYSPLQNTDGSVFAEWDWELPAKSFQNGVMMYRPI